MPWTTAGDWVASAAAPTSSEGSALVGWAQYFLCELFVNFLSLCRPRETVNPVFHYLNVVIEIYIIYMHIYIIAVYIAQYRKHVGDW